MKAKLLLFIAFFLTIFAQGQDINVRQGVTDYLTTSTYTYSDLLVNGTTSVTFTVQNLSAPNLLISGAAPRVVISGPDADEFIIPSGSILNPSIANGGNDTFIVQFKPTTIGPKTAVMTIESNDPDEAIYTVNLAGNAVVSKNSTISLPSPAYTYTSTIPYDLYQSPTISSPLLGFEIIQFRINDAVNTENLATILTGLTLSISNSANIRTVALYDDLDNFIAEEAGAALVSFSGLNITAPAGGTKTFKVLVTFNAQVTDNQNISIGITSATANPAGSNFAAANAGGATSSASATVNKIVVIATALNFVEQPSNTDTFVAMDPAVTVEAVDGLGNRDLNYTTAVILTSTGDFHSTGTLPINDANNNAVAGLASFPVLIHETQATNLVLTANSVGLASANSSQFNIEPASAANNYFRSAQSGKWSENTSWETSGNNVDWIPADLVPTAASRSIVIRPLHIITCETTQEADQMTIQATGGLRILTGANFNINNGSGTDLTVQGLLEHAGGTFTQSVGTAMSVSATGTYLHSIPSSTLTLPRFAWAGNSTCSITGLTNAVPITATNMDQVFSKLIWNNPGQSAVVNVDTDTFKTASSLTLGASANNKLCISSTGVHANSLAAVTVNGGTLTGFSGTASGTLTMSTLVLNAGTFVGNNSNGTTAINNTGTITINTDGHYIASTNSGIVNAAVNAITLNNNGKLTLINSASSGNVTFNFAPTRTLTLNSSSSLLLENISSPGVATINIANGFTCPSTATPAVDFGFGDVTGNIINLAGNFSKTIGGSIITSSTTHASTGFVFSGGNQTFTFAAGTSSGVNYTANNTGTFTCGSNFVFGTALTQKTIFTVNAPTLNLGTRVFTGNATKAQFNIANGVNVLTSNTGGLGGTSATGNFVGFASIGDTPADGRVSFGANCNYTFTGSTVTPFPVGGTWPTPNDVVIGGNITSNYTTPFNLNGTLTINAARTFKLNPALGANLNLKGLMTVNGTFDLNSQNLIVDAGGASLVVNGTFITRTAAGFNGAGTHIGSIPFTLATTSTVNYAGANQIITDAAYGNLTISGTGVKTLNTNSITAAGELNVTGTSNLLKIETGKTLSIADKITTTAVFPTTTPATIPTRGILLENNASLVQINAVDNATNNENTGNIKIIRDAKPMFRYDFTYWSSPVGSGFTLANLSPVTLFDKYQKWNHSANPQVWQKINYGTEAMVAGRGYSVRAPQPFPLETAPGAVAQVLTANFVGVPNNGKVEHAITGSTTTEKWNLLGNPYPSAISASSFVTQNSSVLGGTLYFWTHNTTAVGGGAGGTFNYNSTDYATWNSTGGVGTAATSTGAGTNGNFTIPSGNIAAGQAFFVKGIADGAGTAEFNNTMRITGNNNQFFKSASESTTDNGGRVWLNLKGATKGFNQVLVGYLENATNEYDVLFDGESFGGNQVTFYTILDDKDLVIQGRALPFNVQDEVPLGYSTTLTGNLTIEIDRTDGLMVDQAVYLEDNLLNVVHNLKDSSYTFAATPGTNNSRFVLRYAPAENLANPTFDDAIKNLTIRKNNDIIYINSTYEPIKTVSVYDITGRLLFEQTNCNSTHFEINSVVQNQQVLVVKVQLNNGGVSTTKVW